MIAVVVVGLIVWHHRTQLSTASNQAGSGAAATPGRGPVLAAGGAASTGALPAGFRTVQMSAATLGTAAGYTVAVPDTWNVSTRGLAMVARAPGGRTFLEIDLTPHTKADMIAEANYLVQITQQQHKFPGYRTVSIRRANIRGGSGAAWEFTWQDPAVGTIRALDLLVHRVHAHGAAVVRAVHVGAGRDLEQSSGRLRRRDAHVPAGRLG